MYLELMQELHSQFLFHCIWLVSLAVLRREGFVKFTFVWIKTCQLEILGNLVPRAPHIFQSLGLVPCLNMGIEWGHPTVQKVLLRTKNRFCEPTKNRAVRTRLVFLKRCLSSILEATITQPILFQTWEKFFWMLRVLETAMAPDHVTPIGNVMTWREFVDGHDFI